MSVQQFFNEVEAVAAVLQEYVSQFNRADNLWVYGDADEDVLETEEFTAIWQAAELLSRAHAVLLPMVQFETMKRMALNIPDPAPKVEKQAPKQPKKAHLFGPDGKPLP